MRAGAAKLLCRRRFLLHRGVGEGESPTPCLYLPRGYILHHIPPIRKVFFTRPIFRAVFLQQNPPLMRLYG